MSQSAMTDNAKSEMGRPMYKGPGDFIATVTHAVELNDFPSQWRGPVLAVYCFDEEDELCVEPRWLTPTGVGVNRGPMFRLRDLRNRVTPKDIVWFIDNEINFELWRKLAILFAR